MPLSNRCWPIQRRKPRQLLEQGDADDTSFYQEGNLTNDHGHQDPGQLGCPARL